MGWQQIHAASISQQTNPAPIYHTFLGSLLIVAVSSPVAQPSWRKAGILTPIFTIPDVGLVRGLSRRINLDTQLVEFSQTGGLSYSVEFWLHGWITNADLIFWQQA